MGRDRVFAGQRVRPDNHPLDGRVVWPDTPAQIFRSLLVVGLRRHEYADEADRAALAERYFFIQIAVSVAGGVHQHELDGVLWLAGPDSPQSRQVAAVTSRYGGPKIPRGVGGDAGPGRRIRGQEMGGGKHLATENTECTEGRAELEEK